ncbi:MAG: SEL1-like repeat protein, partial [Bacteroidales bacterium]|nr:SEL1-like repeat protein [Bacteroidales bacterium]
RKGTLGYPKDLKRAFELYRSCRLPYAYYRVGEFYEYGWGVEKDLEKAKENYRIAYRADHVLARRKLSEFDFLH